MSAARSSAVAYPWAGADPPDSRYDANMSPLSPVAQLATLALVPAACAAPAARSASSNARSALDPGISPHSSRDRFWFTSAAFERDAKTWGR